MRPENRTRRPAVLRKVTAMSTSPTRVFGPIPGVDVGTSYPTRKALAASGLHRPTQKGISSSEKEGADSIVASGGDEDDADYGDVLIYTGMCGNDPETKKQIADQR